MLIFFKTETHNMFLRYLCIVLKNHHMKKLFFVLLCTAGFSLTASAQCSGSKTAEAAAPAKACCSSKTASTGAACQPGKTASASTGVEAALAADKSVEKRVCSTSGTTSYVRRVSAGGQTSYEDVTFDEASSTFVSKAKSCGKGAAPGCCAKPGSNKTTSTQPRTTNVSRT